MATTLREQVVKRLQAVFGRYDPLSNLRDRMPRLSALKASLGALERWEGAAREARFLELINSWRERKWLEPIILELTEFDAVRYAEVIKDLQILDDRFRSPDGDVASSIDPMCKAIGRLQEEVL